MTVAHRIQIQIILRKEEDRPAVIGPVVAYYFCSSRCFDRARLSVKWQPDAEYSVLMFQKPNAKIPGWDPTTCCAECDREMPRGSRDAEDIDAAYS